MFEFKRIKPDKHLSVAQITAYHNEYMIYKLSFGKHANPSIVVDSTSFMKVANSSSSEQKKVYSPAGSVAEQIKGYTNSCSTSIDIFKTCQSLLQILHIILVTTPNPHTNIYNHSYLSKGNGYSKSSYYHHHSSAYWRPKQQCVSQSSVPNAYRSNIQNNQKPKQHWVPK